MGSGTTGIACKNLNRNFIGIDKSKKAYEIAVKRIVKF
jgi:DNA modification methylase